MGEVLTLTLNPIPLNPGGSAPLHISRTLKHPVTESTRTFRFSASYETLECSILNLDDFSYMIRILQWETKVTPEKVLILKGLGRVEA